MPAPLRRDQARHGHGFEPRVFGVNTAAQNLGEAPPESLPALLKRFALIPRAPKNPIQAVVGFGLDYFYSVETHAFLFQQLCLLPIRLGSRFECQRAVRAYHSKPGQWLGRASHRGADHPRVPRKPGGARNLAVTHDATRRNRGHDLPDPVVEFIPEATHRSSLLSPGAAEKRPAMDSRWRIWPPRPWLPSPTGVAAEAAFEREQ